MLTTIRIILLTTLCCSLALVAEEVDRRSGFPYVSGDTFREFCTFIVDETGSTLIPEKVQYGDTIFLKTDFLGDFFKNLHPKIANPYILISHNSDTAAPGPYASFLDDPKIIAWFGQNMEGTPHPKMHPIPIGIANRMWGHGNVEMIQEAKKTIQDTSRDILLYMNFQIANYPSERTLVYNLFKGKKYCMTSSPIDFQSYLSDLGRSKFVLSPRGNGLDCHRTWEALYMGAIPIVRSSTIDSLYDGLPVVIVTDWHEVTEKFLQKKWKEMSKKKYNLERRYAVYWFELISSTAF